MHSQLPVTNEQKLFKDCEAFFSQAISLRPRFATRSLENGGLEVSVIRDDPKAISALMLAVSMGLAIVFFLYWPQALPVVIAVSAGCSIGLYAYLNSFASQVVVAQVSPKGRISRFWCEADLQLLPNSNLSVVRLHGLPGDMTYLYALTISDGPGDVGLIACSQFKSFVLSLHKILDLYVEETLRKPSKSTADKRSHTESA